MKKYILPLSCLLVFASCANFTFDGSREVASRKKEASVRIVENGLKVYRHKDTSLEISAKLEGLSFDDEKSQGESVAKIIALVNENRAMLLSAPNNDSVPVLRFYPEIKTDDGRESLGQIVVDHKSASVRLQQAYYFYKEGKNGNRQKVYVPFLGADIVAFVRDGKLESLNSSLILPPTAASEMEKMQSASLEDLKESTPEDRVAIFDSIINLPDEDQQQQALSELFNDKKKRDQKNWVKMFLTDVNVLYRFAEKHKNNARLVFARLNSSFNYELAWEFEAPLGLPLKIYLKADKMSPNKFFKSSTLLTDVKVKIYRGFLLKPDLFVVKRGDSETYGQYPVEKSSPKKQAIVNLSKVVEYFKKDFSWNSYDNRGSDIIATVKMGGSLSQNAAWVTAPYNQFIFGKDGAMLADMTSGLDVIGHEYFHSIVSRTAKLDSPGEHGALNEHLADLFGVGFESDVINTAYDQKIGEAVVVKNQKNGSNIGLRDFLYPERSLSEQAMTMREVGMKFGESCVPNEKNDRCGVHYSNGVLNNVMGQFIQAKGWSNIKEMVFQVVSKRLRSSSDFMDYRNQMIEECKITPAMSKGDCMNLSNLFEKAGLAPVTSKGNSNISINSCSAIQDICRLIKSSGIKTEACQKCGM